MSRISDFFSRNSSMRTVDESDDTIGEMNNQSRIKKPNQRGKNFYHTLRDFFIFFKFCIFFQFKAYYIIQYQSLNRNGTPPVTG